MKAYRSPIEGSWYPDDPSELATLIERAIRRSEQRTGAYPRPGGLGFVVPHAAPMYSGTVAASAYRHLTQQPPRRVVLLGFSHWHAHSGIRIPALAAYATPLGEVEVDAEAVRRLTGSKLFQGIRPEASSDHSVEIQMPLLRRMLPDARVVPLYVGSLDAETSLEAARAIAGLLDGRTVIVASSDFTHYGPDFGFEPFPADEHIADKLRNLDHSVMQAAGSVDEQMFARQLVEDPTVCGQAPIRLMMRTLGLVEGPEIFQDTLDYQTSGEITGDYTHSVSYGALGYFPASAFELDNVEQEALLDSAYRTLAHLQSTGQRQPIPPAHRTAALERPAAVFVTLYREGQLRGCIGTTSAFQPLADAVPEMTLCSALTDPRTGPVLPFEKDITIEISVLTPLKRIAGRDRFRLNEHGVYLEVDGFDAILLPHVASEWNLSRDEFLCELAKKAGLDAGVYEDPRTKLSVFRAQVFGRRKPGYSGLGEFKGTSTVIN